jgi:hypothetical protein
MCLVFEFPAHFVRAVRLDARVVLVLARARSQGLNGIELLLILIKFFLVTSLQKLLVNLIVRLLLWRIKLRTLLFLIRVDNLGKVPLSADLLSVIDLLRCLVLRVLG